MIYCVSQQLPPLIIVEGNLATLAPLLEGGVKRQLAFLPSNMSKLAVILLQESKPTL